MLQPDHFLQVFIGSQAEEPLLLILQADEMWNQWRHHAVDLSVYAGKALFASFNATTDGNVPTTFQIDDVSIRAYPPASDR